MESIKLILCSPLWLNNNLIRGQNLYINNWFKNEIKQISDLLDIHRNFYQFDVLKEMYGVNGTFLDYTSLIHKIPNYLKNMTGFYPDEVLSYMQYLCAIFTYIKKLGT